MKNNLKRISWILLAIGLLFVGVFYYRGGDNFQQNTGVPQVCSKKKCFTVELARTQAEQELGLMHREVMAEDHGMLFIFPKVSLYNFWMKNTLIPLDMIRIDDQLRVVRIITAPACTADPCPAFKPEIGAKYVLEVNAGIAEKYRIVEGSVIKFQNIK